jgi:hypothetical protein
VDVKVTVSPSLITSFEGVNPSLVSVIVRVDERRGILTNTKISMIMNRTQIPAINRFIGIYYPDFELFL